MRRDTRGFACLRARAGHATRAAQGRAASAPAAPRARAAARRVFDNADSNNPHPA